MNFCEICGARASHKCRICGRFVCDKHYVEDRSICVYCDMTLCELCGKRLSISICPICGRQVCDTCSLQVTTAIRVCRECYQQYRLDKERWPPPFLLARDRKRAEKIASLTLKVLRASM